METQTMTIPVDAETARSFYEAPPETRRQLELMLRLRLWELTNGMHFEIITPIVGIETIATGSGIRILRVLRKQYGGGRWRKLKGTATVRLEDGTPRFAELHWFEAHGIGKRKMRIKRFLD